MSKSLPEEIEKELARAVELHQRTSSDYQKCVEFNRLMSDLLGRAEDAGLNRLADRIMDILMECNPKEGSSCEKSSRVGERVKRLL
ncbi:MAG: hypothetical protein ABFR97_10660 [Thermodesulfobacteriota bacterium]